MSLSENKITLRKFAIQFSELLTTTAAGDLEITAQ